MIKFLARAKTDHNGHVAVVLFMLATLVCMYLVSDNVPAIGLLRGYTLLALGYQLRAFAERYGEAG